MSADTTVAAALCHRRIVVHKESPMAKVPRVTLYYAPQSRSSVTFALLEELGVEYDLHVLNLKAGTQRDPEYLAINPMGKVPAIRHGDALVTEQPAVMMYLADLYPEAGLAPALGDPLRGPYLRWMVFYGSCFEPAIADRSMEREPGPRMSSPYGDFDSVLMVVTDQLERGPYLLGEKFSAADVLWGSAFRWMTMFKLVPESSLINAYIERVTSRPGMVRAAEKDAAMAAKQED